MCQRQQTCQTTRRVVHVSGGRICRFKNHPLPRSRLGRPHNPAKIIHLLYGEAVKSGRDIFWDQNFKYNLEIRKCLETVLETYTGDRDTPEFNQFLVYAKRVFFSNGIHHHYAEEKSFRNARRPTYRVFWKHLSVRKTA